MPAKPRPNSMLEWVAGRNITPRPKPSQPREVLKLEVFTDDEAETDTLALTYPRSGSRKKSATRKSSSKQVSKQVRFANVPQQPIRRKKPMKQLVKQPVESDLEVETSGSEESEEPLEYVKPKRRAKRLPPKDEVCFKYAHVPPEESSSSDDDDHIPHPTCPCKDCVSARKKLKKAHRLFSLINEGQPKDQQAPPNGNKPAAEVEAPASSDNKGDANGEAAPKDTNGTQKNGSQKNGSQKNAQEPGSDKTPSDAGLSLVKSNNKAKRLPLAYPPPEIRTPSLLMPVRAQVLQVEHAVETAEDPRPNAFVDNAHGICRVYHGPAYGNPYGSLYPRRGFPAEPLPVGVPHPMQNPYYSGFNPSQMPQQGAGYVPPPPPPAPGMAYPMHMPWPNYQPPEGYKGNNGEKKVSPQVAPPVVPSVEVVPPAEESSQKKAAPADVTEPQKSKDKSSSSRVAPPMGLLTPRTIAAKFSDQPASKPSQGKDDQRGWNSNDGPKSPRQNKSSHGNQNGGNNNGGNNKGGGWGRGSGSPANNSPRASNNDIRGRNHGGHHGNGWGGSPRNSDRGGGHHRHGHGSPRNDHKRGDNGWGGGRHSSPHNDHRRNHSPPKNDGWGGGNNSGRNDPWATGSQQSGSKKSSNRSGNSANQPAASFGGDGWGGGWDSTSVKNQTKGNGSGWGGGSGSNRDNNGGWGGSPANNSPRGSSKGKNKEDGSGWGNGWGGSGSHHGSNRSPAKGSNNGWGSPSGGNHRNNHNSGWGGDNHGHSSDSRSHKSPPGGGGGGTGHHHKQTYKMPGSWESLPSGTGSSSRGHQRDHHHHHRGHHRSEGLWSGGDGGAGRGGNAGPVFGESNSNSNSPRRGAWGGTSSPDNNAVPGGPGAFDGSWASGSAGRTGGGQPSWGDPTAAQSTQPAGGW